MAYKGTIQLTIILVAQQAPAEAGARLFRNHAPWMEATHHRDGDKALLSYDVSKAPELSNPMDPSSAPTGNTCFVLNEIYETEAGVADPYKQAASSWQDFPALMEWMEKCTVTAVPAAPIFNSLW